MVQKARTLYDKNGNPVVIEQFSHRTPIKGYYSVYIKDICSGSKANKEWLVSLLDISKQLTGNQLTWFLILVQHADHYNVVETSISKIVESYTGRSSSEGATRTLASRIKSALIAAHAITPTKAGSVMINPFVVLPRKSTADKENQFKAQQLWRYANFDKEAYFDGIEELHEHYFT